MEKRELWGARRKLSEVQLGELERIYAHFHRVLGPLLVELSELPGTVWLEEVQRTCTDRRGRREPLCPGDLPRLQLRTL